MDFLTFTIFEGLAIVAFILYCVTTYFCSHKSRRSKLYPPGPQRLPLIGNLHQVGFNPVETFLRMKEKYGNVFAFDFAGIPGVVLNDYKIIKEAYAKPEFCGRPSLYVFLMRSGGDKIRGMLFTEGKIYQDQRRLLLKSLRDFGFGKRSMEFLIQNEIRELLQTLSAFNGKPFETENIFNLAIINSLWSITTGARFAHDDPKLLDLVKNITTGVKSFGLGAVFLFSPWVCKYLPQLSGYNQFMEHQGKTLALIREQIKQHKATFQDEELRDVIDSQLQDIMNCSDPNSSIYKEEGELSLSLNLLDLFYGGLETASTTLSWTFLYLSLYQKIQEKMFDEIKSVVGTARLPSLADRPMMPYVEAVILEVLRHSTLIPFSFFHRTTADVTFHGYEIPNNTLVLANVYEVHRNPQIWGDPDIFRPERFINDRDGKVNRAQEAYLLAFSTGKRVCPGESLARDELFLFISSLFQKFSVSSDPTKPKPTLDAEISFMRTPKSYEFILHERYLKKFTNELF